jgi:CRISPR-associated protein Csd1
MGWTEELCKTYDRCSSLVGKKDDAGNILLPLGHLINNAQITITIDEKGNFIRAEKNEKEDQPTVMPATEGSASRSSGISPMPLCDKLCYVAKDYDVFDTSDKSASEKYNSYMSQLHHWSSRADAPISVTAIFRYLESGNVIHDLQREKLEFDKDDFVRFRIRYSQPGHIENTWEDPELYQSFQKFYTTLLEKRGFDYISGKNAIVTNKLPAKVRNQGDKAKLISSNDTSGYTFRGRFLNADEAAEVGYVSSQKAHNALRWLIERQGYKNGSESIVAWAPDGRKVDGIFSSTDELFSDLGITDDLKDDPDTAEVYARKLNLAISGYHAVIDDAEKIVIMAVDTADSSPQGRLSITYYQELLGSTFLHNIQKWHQECSWHLSYVKRDEKEWQRRFIGAPSPREIALAAYGTEQSDFLQIDDKVNKKCIDRIIPCIVQARRIPKDIVRAAVRSAGTPTRFNSYNWNKIVEISCALIHKEWEENPHANHKEVTIMSLDLSNHDRSYLFGRLLAVFKRMEEYVNYKNGVDRPTAAETYWNAYTCHPAKTAMIIRGKIQPYVLKLKGGAKDHYSRLMEEIINVLSEDNHFSNQPLNEQYLIGYYCQYSDLRKKKDSEVTTDEQEEKNNE